MDAYELCGVYLSLKLHFKDNKYNFQNSSGKIFIKPETFQKRKDRFMFHKIAKKYSDEHIIPFLVSNFVVNENYWTGDLASPLCDKNYNEWRKINESMSHFYTEDLEKFEDYKGLVNSIKVLPNEHPKLLTDLLEGNIRLETMVILNNIFGLVQMWDSKIDDDIIYPKIARKIQKYGSFLDVNVSKYKELTRNVLMK